MRPPLRPLMSIVCPDSLPRGMSSYLGRFQAPGHVCCDKAMERLLFLGSPPMPPAYTPPYLLAFPHASLCPPMPLYISPCPPCLPVPACNPPPTPYPRFSPCYIKSSEVTGYSEWRPCGPGNLQPGLKWVCLAVVRLRLPLAAAQRPPRRPQPLILIN